MLQQRIVTLLGAVGGHSVALVHGSRAAPPAEGRWEVAPRVCFDLPLDKEGDVPLHLDAVVAAAEAAVALREGVALRQRQPPLGQ